MACEREGIFRRSPRLARRNFCPRPPRAPFSLKISIAIRGRADYLLRSRSSGEAFNHRPIMSQHRSLKGASTITVKRNVLKRFERVEVLKKRGAWKADSRVMGLPKTKPED